MAMEGAQATRGATDIGPTGPRIPELSVDASLETQLDAYNRSGVVILHDVIKPELLKTLNDQIDPWMEEIPLGCINSEDPGTQDFMGGRTKRLTRTLVRSREIREQVALTPRVLELAKAILLPYCKNIRMHTLQVIEIHPGEEAQKLHRDDGLWPVPGTRYPLSLSVQFALSDYEAEIGATRVVPGSQHWPESKFFQEAHWRDFCRPPAHLSADRVDAVEMPAGSAVIWSGQILHGAGANTTADRFRRCIGTGFHLGWLIGEANLTLLYPPEIAKGFPQELQRLMGYQLHGILGGLETGEDPITLLEDR